MMEKTIMNEMFQSFNEAKKRTIWASLNFPLYFPIVKSVLLILTSCYSFYKLCRVFDRKRATHLCFLMFAFLTIIMNISRSTSNAISSTYMFQIDDDDFVQNFRPRNVNDKFLPIANIFIPVKQTENRSVYWSRWGKSDENSFQRWLLRCYWFDCSACCYFQHNFRLAFTGYNSFADLQTENY